MENSVLLLLLVFFDFLKSEEIPSFLHVCRLSDPLVEQCFISTGENLKPYLIKGIPEYSIPSIEPLVMGQLIKEDVGDLQIEANDVNAWGCSNYSIKSARVDHDNQKYQLGVFLPELQIKTRYSVDGKVLLMSVKGQGFLEANITNVFSNVNLDGELYQRNEKTYLRYTTMNMKVQVGDGKVKVYNLFGGDKLLNDVINQTINKNLDVFLKELLPVIERSLSRVFLDIANKVVERFSYEQLFPK